MNCLFQLSWLFLADRLVTHFMSQLTSKSVRK